MSQVRTLFHLHHRGGIGVSDIGDSLGVTSAAASQMLDRLVQNRLIVRSEDPEDRRSKRIALTAQGLEFVHRMAEVRNQWFTAVADEMTPDERTTVAKALKILIAKTGRLETCQSRADRQKGAERL